MTKLSKNMKRVSVDEAVRTVMESGLSLVTDLDEVCEMVANMTGGMDEPEASWFRSDVINSVNLWEMVEGAFEDAADEGNMEDAVNVGAWRAYTEIHGNVSPYDADWGEIEELKRMAMEYFEETGAVAAWM